MMGFLYSLARFLSKELGNQLVNLQQPCLAMTVVFKLLAKNKHINSQLNSQRIGHYTIYLACCCLLGRNLGMNPLSFFHVFQGLVPAVICFLIFFGQIDRKWRLEPKAAYFQGSAPTFFNKILTAHFCSGQDQPAPRSSPPPLFDLVRKVPEITVQDRLCWHDFETYSMRGRIIVKP